MTCNIKLTCIYMYFKYLRQNAGGLVLSKTSEKQVHSLPTWPVRDLHFQIRLDQFICDFHPHRFTFFNREWISSFHFRQQCDVILHVFLKREFSHPDTCNCEKNKKNCTSQKNLESRKPFLPQLRCTETMQMFIL